MARLSRTGSLCSRPGGEQMGPGPQPGHRAQLSPQRLVKRTSQPVLPTAPSAQPRPHQGHACPPRLFGQTCLVHVCVSISSVFLVVADSTSPSLFIPVVCFSFLSVSLSLMTAFSSVCSLLSCDPFHPLALCLPQPVSLSLLVCPASLAKKGPPHLRLAWIARASPSP